MLTIINYGLGNINALVNIYKKNSIEVKIAECTKDLNNASRLILPGVGSFDWAITRLNNSGMREKIESLVLNSRIPVLGICVGMQIMAKGSEEGIEEGLGWIDANVKKFDVNKDEELSNNQLPLPHMGWNSINDLTNSPIFHGIDDLRFYFLHSYYFSPKNDIDIIANSEYNDTFTAAICSKNIYGVQFHPEKSHQSGIKLLRNFISV
ncbi:imidazole glycerol phosphate synthase subunit HisH [bacterium]|nr:imidazole glycerol phosphate synthase subunit HisH [bacterium]|tara:strand:- start:796 stop:1419 length:624 start_codon:yes stop_codon:yes gene_type:complete